MTRILNSDWLIFTSSTLGTQKNQVQSLNSVHEFETLHYNATILFHRLYITLIFQISDVLSKIELKKKDIEKLQEKEKVQMAAFVESIADNKFTEYLTKVYKKKIKRSKKNTSEGCRLYFFL